MATTETALQVYKLGTYGKLFDQLIKFIWPNSKIELKRGPEQLLEDALTKHAPELIAHVMASLPKELAEIPNLIADYAARQMRVEAMLLRMAEAFEANQNRSTSNAGSDRDSDGRNGIPAIAGSGTTE